jgi:hypothetical protein
VGRHHMYVYSSVSRYPKVVAATCVETWVTRFLMVHCAIFQQTIIFTRYLAQQVVVKRVCINVLSCLWRWTSLELVGKIQLVFMSLFCYSHMLKQTQHNTTCHVCVSVSRLVVKMVRETSWRS